MSYKRPTVSQLIAALEKFPKDMPVYTTWEGIYGTLGYPVVEAHNKLGIDIVIIDAEYGDWDEGQT